MVTLEVKNNSAAAYPDKLAELIDLLSYSFTWHRTEQGYEYWEEVNSNLVELADKATQTVEFSLGELSGGGVALYATSKGIEQTILIFHEDGTTQAVGSVYQDIPLKRSGGPCSSILVRSPLDEY